MRRPPALINMKIYSSLHLVVERMEELMEGTSLEESGWFQGEIFQITCSVSWYGRFWSTTNFWYSWKRAPLPPSSLAGSRRGTEACRAAAGGHGLTTGFVTSISSYSFSYFIQFCNYCHHLGPFILLLVPLLYLLGDLSSPQVHPKVGLLNYIHHLVNNLYHHQYSKRSITELNEI